MRVAALVALLLGSTGRAGMADEATIRLTYDDHVRPILREHCLGCHNADEAEGDLNMASYAGLLQGSSSGKIVAAGRARSSKLYQVVSHAVEPKMPPEDDKLADDQLAVIERWIDAGLLENAGSVARAAPTRRFVPPTAPVGPPAGPPPMPGDLPRVELSPKLRPHPVTALAASPWAPLVAVSGHESVLLYGAPPSTESEAKSGKPSKQGDGSAEVPQYRPLGLLAFPERIAYVLKFSRDGRLLLAGGGRGAHSGRVVVWDVPTGKRVMEVGDEYDVVLAADISADQRFVALGGPGRLVKIFATSDGELLHRIKRHTDWITALEFSPDGKLLATGDRAGGVHVWESETGGIYATYAEHTGRITDLSWRSDGKLLATAGDDGRLILWDTSEGWPVESIAAHTKSRKAYAAHVRGVLSVEFTRNGELVTCGRDGTVSLRDENGKQLHAFSLESALPTAVAAIHDGKQIIAGDDRGRILVWDRARKELIGRATTTLRRPAPDGSAPAEPSAPPASGR